MAEGRGRGGGLQIVCMRSIRDSGKNAVFFKVWCKYQIANSEVRTGKGATERLLPHSKSSPNLIARAVVTRQCSSANTSNPGIVLAFDDVGYVTEP